MSHRLNGQALKLRKEQDMVEADLTCCNDGSGALILSLSGDWLLANELPLPAKVLDQCRASPEIRHISFDTLQSGKVGQRFSYLSPEPY